jgi:hypothetical protein
MTAGTVKGRERQTQPLPLDFFLDSFKGKDPFFAILLMIENSPFSFYPRRAIAPTRIGAKQRMSCVVRGVGLQINRQVVAGAARTQSRHSGEDVPGPSIDAPLPRRQQHAHGSPSSRAGADETKKIGAENSIEPIDQPDVRVSRAEKSKMMARISHKADWSPNKTRMDRPKGCSCC